MPISYRIDAGRGVALTTATGTLTDRDILEHKKRLHADPAFTPGMHEMSDVRGVSDLQVTPHGVKRMVAHDAAQGSDAGSHRLAIIASEDVVYGMARMYETLSDGNPSPSVAVFRDYDAAAKWLGLAPDDGA